MYTINTVTDDMINISVHTFAPTGPGIDNSDEGFSIENVSEFHIEVFQQTVRVVTLDNKHTHLDFRNYRISFPSNDPYNGYASLLINEMPPQYITEMPLTGKLYAQLPYGPGLFMPYGVNLILEDVTHFSFRPYERKIEVKAKNGPPIEFDASNIWNINISHALSIPEGNRIDFSVYEMR